MTSDEEAAAQPQPQNGSFAAATQMYVIKRNGKSEIMKFDKILKRIRVCGEEAGIRINYTALAIKVIDQLYDNIPTTKIDELTAELCFSMSSIHVDYGTLASRIIHSNHHRNTSETFSTVMTLLYKYLDKHGQSSPLISEDVYNIVRKYRKELDALCDYSRDYLIDYFGFKTLEKSYLMRVNRKIVERIQHMWLRVSIGIHGDNMDHIRETYFYMSQKYFIHATPTLFNAGTPHPQNSSCFLLGMEEDSIEGIFNTLRDCAFISKWGGGIGMHAHNVRAKGSHIRGTNGVSNGLVPMLRVFNNTAKYVDQGGGKRNGSIAVYIEPWHADIIPFLQMKKNHGDEELKARDLFYALWVPDLFMERMHNNDKWTLMCPDECPGLSDCWGADFVALYEKYEREGKGRETISARSLWIQILDSQMETGTPYLLYKDAANRKSNQQNLGTIKSSNLCVAPETTVLTDRGHVPICDLAGQRANVWNGQEFSEVEVFQTGHDQPLIEVHASDGCVLHCTPYHKFYVQDEKGGINTVEAQQLKEGDKLAKCSFPVIEGSDSETMLYPYTHGFFCGDGTYNKYNEEPSPCVNNSLDGKNYCKRHIDFYKEEEETEDTDEDDIECIVQDKQKCKAFSYLKKPTIALYDEKQKLIEYLDYRKSPKQNKNKTQVLLPLDIAEKFWVPLKCNIQTKMLWFAGYCDADGTISNNGSNQQLQVCSINKEFLFNVKLMLQTCGVNSKIRMFRDASQNYLPNGQGDYQYYDTKPAYRLLINSYDLFKLSELGFSPKRLVVNKTRPQRNSSQFIQITKVVDNGRIADTFCFTEPKRHAGIFGGLYTSQCTEIIEYSDGHETAVCNLASIALPTFYDPQTRDVNYEKLHEIAGILVYNLNAIIDGNYYPTAKTDVSNKRHRPIGIGVQGLADLFMLLQLPFESAEARTINRRIFETIYHGALERSCAMAEETGPYSTFAGSPASRGVLQFDMWEDADPGTERYDWPALKARVVAGGLKNSLLLAPMPTASTSQILGFNECFEPITSNIYSRGTLAGQFVLANKYLMQDLQRLGLWDEQIKNNIVANNGSVQQITLIPEHLRQIYKTVWEIPMKCLIDMAADRGAFICQSQSMNLWIEDPTYRTLTSMFFYGWKRGLKTGIYYLRRRARHQAQQFTIQPMAKQRAMSEDEEKLCEMCSA